MALDIPPPSQILTHAHWTLGREKMAKSTGNVVNPFYAMDRFGVDTIRFYLVHDGGILQDSDYTNELIIERYKKGLQGGLGNLTSRIMRGKRWNVRRAVERGSNGELKNMDGPLGVQRQLLQSAAVRFTEKMDALDVSGALKEVMSNVYAVSIHLLFIPCRLHDYGLNLIPPPQTNAFLQHMSPWDFCADPNLVKLNDPVTQLRVDQTVYLCVEAIRISAILLQPFIPSSMVRLLDMLGIDAERRSLRFAEFGGDNDYGVAAVDLGRGYVGTLFPPLPTSE